MEITIFKVNNSCFLKFWYNTSRQFHGSSSNRFIVCLCHLKTFFSSAQALHNIIYLYCSDAKKRLVLHSWELNSMFSLVFARNFEKARTKGINILLHVFSTILFLHFFLFGNLLMLLGSSVHNAFYKYIVDAFFWQLNLNDGWVRLCFICRCQH